MLLRRASVATPGERRKYFDQLVPLVYRDLRARARMQIGRKMQKWDTLRPTALVHEAWERLVPCGIEFESRNHFLNVAAKAMRRLIIDRARKRRAVKRGSASIVTSLSEAGAVQVLSMNPEVLLSLDQAISSLRPDQVQLVELRFYSNLSYEEVAAALGIHPDTARSRWNVIRTLLYAKLKPRVSHAAG